MAALRSGPGAATTLHARQPFSADERARDRRRAGKRADGGIGGGGGQQGVGKEWSRRQFIETCYVFNEV